MIVKITYFKKSGKFHDVHECDMGDEFTCINEIISGLKQSFNNNVWPGLWGAGKYIIMIEIPIPEGLHSPMLILDYI